MAEIPEKQHEDRQTSGGAPSPEVSPAEDFSVPSAATQSPEELLRELRERNRQLTEQVLRSRADLENVRKRAAREKEEFQQYALGQTLEAFLPILDGFELALTAEGGGEDYRRGVEIIYLQFLGTLQRLGLEPIEAKGKPFDPNLHEAVMTVETDDFPDQTVTDELQRGFMFRKRLLRPAKVKVAKQPS